MIHLIFLVLLVITSIIDIRTKNIPQALIIMIFACGFFCDSQYKILGLILSALPFFVANLVQVNCTGGGDLYLMGVCGFYLGGIGGLVAIVIGLSCCVIIIPIWRKIKHIEKTEPFALFPFLGTGCAAVLFLGGYFIK